MNAKTSFLLHRIVLALWLSVSALKADDLPVLKSLMGDDQKAIPHHLEAGLNLISDGTLTPAYPNPLPLRVLPLSRVNFESSAKVPEILAPRIIRISDNKDAVSPHRIAMVIALSQQFAKAVPNEKNRVRHVQHFIDTHSKSFRRAILECQFQTNPDIYYDVAWTYKFPELPNKNYWETADEAKNSDAKRMLKGLKQFSMAMAKVKEYEPYQPLIPVVYLWHQLYMDREKDPNWGIAGIGHREVDLKNGKIFPIGVYIHFITADTYILAHEISHTIGYEGHSKNRQSFMFRPFKMGAKIIKRTGDHPDDLWCDLVGKYTGVKRRK